MPDSDDSRSPGRTNRVCLVGRRGEGLIAVIVATFLLGVVSLGLVEFFAKGRLWFDQEEHKRAATLLAQDAMERTVAQPYAQVLPWIEQRTVATHDYDIAVTVQTNVPEPDIKTVTVRVAWDATARARREVNLVTLVYDN